MLSHVNVATDRRAGTKPAPGQRGDVMATMVGGDLEQLQVLEQQFRTDADVVAELRARISAMLAGTAWTGPAADQFREEWNSTFAAALTHLAGALTENATLIAGRRQAIFAATA